jgi:hypothetical protein
MDKLRRGAGLWALLVSPAALVAVLAAVGGIALAWASRR